MIRRRHCNDVVVALVLLSMAQNFLFFLLLSFYILGVYSKSNFTVVNKCNYTVWPGIYSIGKAQIPTTGFVLQKGESRKIIPPNSWSGLIWGRTNCSENSTGYFSCMTGDCGSGKLECSSGSTPPMTLAEFTVNKPNAYDLYDVSLLNGYNLPIYIAPQTSPETKCEYIDCSIDLYGKCPSQLQKLSSGGDIVACMSACQALKQDQYCCSRERSSQNNCTSTSYSDVFKNACPNARSYGYDDVRNTLQCPVEADYVITFCTSLTDSSPSAAFSPSPTLIVTPIPPPAKGPSIGSVGNGELPTIAIAASVVAFIIIAIILFSTRFCFLRRKTKKNHNLTVDETGNVDGNEISEPESFLYDLSSIKAATNNFSADNKIGEGGFGEVFKGNLNNGQQVAVKRLSKHSGQGEREFKNEVLVLAKLQHRNLVSLLGYCLEKEEKMLIYEYVTNESLDFILFDEHKKQSLDWSKRYKIIGGVARGILYLHEDSRLRIIHRDIKASNVLLDTDMNAKISDFGLARIVGFDEVQGSTKRVVGTFGYMSPEYITRGQFSVKSDVFSFGVLVLEIISGKKNNRFYQSSEHLLSYAFKLWTEGKHFDLVDTALGDSFSKTEVTQCIHIGLLCVQEDLGDRPTMASVVHMLNSSSMTSLPIPHQPAFFLQGGVLPISNLPVPLRLSVN